MSDIHTNFPIGTIDYLGSHIYQKEATIHNYGVAELQIALWKAGYLKGNHDVDGVVGKGTHGAVQKYFEDKAIAENDVKGTPAEPIRVLTHVPHYSQGAPLIRDIKLGMDAGADTCQKSGCLSTALWCCLAAQRDENFPHIDSFIEHIVSCECYTDDSLLIQAKACAEFGFRYQRQISAYAAKNYLRDGIPIIIQIRKPHTHFLVGIGFDDAKGYAYHDPGTREGNFYKGERWIESRDVTRYDVAIPDASKKAGV